MKSRKISKISRLVVLLGAVVLIGSSGCASIPTIQFPYYETASGDPLYKKGEFKEFGKRVGKAIKEEIEYAKEYPEVLKKDFGKFSK